MSLRTVWRRTSSASSRPFRSRMCSYCAGRADLKSARLQTQQVNAATHAIVQLDLLVLRLGLLVQLLRALVGRHAVTGTVAKEERNAEVRELLVDVEDAFEDGEASRDAELAAVSLRVHCDGKSSATRSWLKGAASRAFELLLNLRVLGIAPLVRISERERSCDACERTRSKLDRIGWSRVGRDLEHGAEDDAARDGWSEGGGGGGGKRSIERSAVFPARSDTPVSIGTPRHQGGLGRSIPRDITLDDADADSQTGQGRGEPAETLAGDEDLALLRDGTACFLDELRVLEHDILDDFIDSIGCEKRSER